MSGVAQVSIFGDRSPAIRIQIDPAKLAASGLTLEETRNTLVTSTSNAAKGTINADKLSFTIAANDQLTEADRFNDVILAYRNGAPIRVRDVGRRSTRRRTIARSRPGQNDSAGILLPVFKQPGANVIETVDQIKAQLPSCPPAIPAAIKVETILRPHHDHPRVGGRRRVDAGAHHRPGRAGDSALPAQPLGDGDPVLAVPLALIGTFAAMYVLGFSLDNLSLMGLTIAVGFVVDDAIVMIENIVPPPRDGKPPFQAALNGSGEIGFTIVSISLSLIAVFIPLLLMGGIVGRLFREFAVTVTITIVVSAFVSLTLTPMLCARFLHEKGTSDMAGSTGCSNAASTRCCRAIGARSTSRCAIIAIDAGCLPRHRGADAWHALHVIPKGFFPQQDTGLIVGAVGGGAGHLLRRDGAASARARGDRHRGIPMSPASAGFIGAPAGQTMNDGRMFITLKPRDERDASATEIIARLRPQLAKVEGAASVPAAGAGHQRRRPRRAHPVPIHAAGPELDELNEWAPKLLAKLRRHCPRSPGVAATSSSRAALDLPSTAIRPPASGSAALIDTHPVRRLRPTAESRSTSPSSTATMSSSSCCPAAASTAPARPALREVAADRAAGAAELLVEVDLRQPPLSRSPTRGSSRR